MSLNLSNVIGGIIMETIQVIFEVPRVVQEGINSGALRLFGGVVRNQKGEIVYHLRDVLEIVEKANTKNKMIAAGVGILGTFAVVSGTYAVYKILNKKNILPNVINDFNQSFVEYIIAAKNMEINTDVINKLDDSAELLKDILKNKDKRLNLEGALDLQQLNELIDSVYRYTLDLIDKNMMEVNEIERSEYFEFGSNIVDLQNYLQLQRKVFDRCA